MICVQKLRGNTCSNVLRRRLEKLTKELGNFESSGESREERAVGRRRRVTSWTSWISLPHIFHMLRGTQKREATIAGRLVTVKFFHEQWMGRSLSLNHFGIKAEKEYIETAHARRRGHPVTDEETAMEDFESNGRGRQVVGMGWERSVGGAGVVITHVTEDAGVVR